LARSQECQKAGIRKTRCLFVADLTLSAGLAMVNNPRGGGGAMLDIKNIVDVKQSNGVIHVIGAVLLPKS
jgi:hypothetical protein